MRLIDADEIRIKPEYMHDICGSVMIRVEDIARIINEMPTINSQLQWISCSERLPELGDVYLVSGKQKYSYEKEWEYFVDCAMYQPFYGYIDNCWNTWNDWDEGQETHIIAWMPLPEQCLERVKRNK